MLGLLQTSGNFRIYEPGVTPRAETPPTPPRAIEGRCAPITGRALLLVGPDANGVIAYFDKLVTAPGGVNIELSLQSPDLEALDALAKKYPNSTLSVGLSLDGLVAEGNAQVGELLDALAAYPRPVFLRLGPEFDLTANGLEPEGYVAAWKTLHNEIQVSGAKNIALVWHSAGACESPFGGYPLEEWYPGDEFVDWMAVSHTAQSENCEGQAIESLLQFAREHYKPVMLVASPVTGGTDLLFEFVRANNDAIRAFLYLNTEPGLFDNPEFLGNWKAETSQQFWLRGSPSLFSTPGK